MASVIDRKATRTMRPEERALFDRILKMRPIQRKRIFELVDLYRRATTEEQAEEIGQALAEVLFGEPKDYTASKLDDDASAASAQALAKHRKYVGDQIRKVRQSQQMSQEELAKKAGIPQSHVCRLETGKHAPSYLTIERIALALGVRKSELDPGFDD